MAAVGSFSQKVCQLDVGDNIWLRGPFGNGYQLPEKPAGTLKLLLVGDSYLISSLLFLGRQAIAAGHQVSMILGAPTADDFVLLEAIEQLRIPYQTVTEDGSQGQKGAVYELLKAKLAGAFPENSMVCVSGTEATLHAAASACAKMGIPCQTAWKTPMKCGIGLCGSCEVSNGWLACVDGPVSKDYATANQA